MLQYTSSFNNTQEGDYRILAQRDTQATVVSHEVTSLTPALQRVAARQQEMIRRARELRAAMGDPVARLVQVLQDIPIDDGDWDRIAQEPYG